MDSTRTSPVAALLGPAAVSDRRGAAATAVAAALAFNFFHTRPYYTLRVDDRVDLISIGLLVVAGLVVGELTVLRRRRSVEARERADDLSDWARLVALAARGDAEALVSEATSTLERDLHLRACRFEPTGREHDSLAVLERDGTVDTTGLRWTRAGFELPADGVGIDVVFGRSRLGRLVLVPTPGVGVPAERRALAIAVADLIAAGRAAAGATAR